MSTRGVIARKTKEGFAGTYNHWDSYPTGLGETLFHLYNGFFQKNMDEMMKVLIDDHLAGWSTINGADFSLEPGYTSYDNTWKNYDEYQKSEDGRRPKCYCHGERREGPNPVFYPGSDLGWLEYGYLFDTENQRMIVLALNCFNGPAMKILADVDLNGPEPDWDTIERGKYPQEEREE